MNKKNVKKLILSTETLRRLSEVQLHEAIGGASLVCSDETKCHCTTTGTA